jgi:5-methylcytosine-specific restriction endonuclease McrA
MIDWNIPAGYEAKIRKRDKRCVYCHVKMKPHPKRRGVPSDKATWEHINNNDVNPNHLINIVICCGRCNSSKGAKKLQKWFESDYCKQNKINQKTVSPAVRKWLKQQQSPATR